MTNATYLLEDFDAVLALTEKLAEIDEWTAEAEDEHDAELALELFEERLEVVAELDALAAKSAAALAA